MTEVLTNSSLFAGIINIDTSRLEIEEEINYYCLIHEEESLKKLLGNTLYTEYLTDNTLVKWTNLIDGITGSFTWNNETKKYTGLKDKFCYLVYSIYTRDQAVSNTPFGDVAAKPSNGEQIYNIPRAIKAYNKWVDAFNDAVDYINYINTETPDTYEDFNTSKLEYVNSWGI